MFSVCFLFSVLVYLQILIIIVTLPCIFIYVMSCHLFYSAQSLFKQSSVFCSYYFQAVQKQLTRYCCFVCSEFQLIHELCLYVLSASQRTELIRATLATLHAFLSWIPLGYIFESPLVCVGNYGTEFYFYRIPFVFTCYLTLHFSLN